MNPPPGAYYGSPYAGHSDPNLHFPSSHPPTYPPGQYAATPYEPGNYAAPPVFSQQYATPPPLRTRAGSSGGNAFATAASIPGMTPAASPWDASSHSYDAVPHQDTADLSSQYVSPQFNPQITHESMV